MSSIFNILALDVGEKRIGVARANSIAKIPEPLNAIEVNGEELNVLNNLIDEQDISELVIGYPRNQKGETTEQTKYVEDFKNRLEIEIPIKYQDESLTSVMAEDYLKSKNKPYNKADIDSHAAMFILKDYLETII